MIRPISMNAVGFRGTNLLEQFKEKQKALPQHMDNQPQFDGAQAVAAYNQAVIETKPKNTLKPSELITLNGDEADKLEGEKVYKSDGSLEAIIQKGDKTTKEYHFFYDKNIKELIEKDNETGKVIKSVHFDKVEGKYISGTVREYDAKTDDEKFTIYRNGKPLLVTEKKNGKADTVYFDPETGEKKVFTKDKIIIPDFDLNKIKEEMKPVDINSVKLPENINTLEGAKKLRSNGTLESVVVTDGNKSTDYIIDFDGKQIESIHETENGKSTKDIDINKNNKVEAITIWQPNLYQTHFNKDGKVECISDEKDGIRRYIDFNPENGTVRAYTEYGPGNELRKRLVFNEKEELTEFTENTTEGLSTVKRYADGN